MIEPSRVALAYERRKHWDCWHIPEDSVQAEIIRMHLRGQRNPPISFYIGNYMLHILHIRTEKYEAVFLLGVRYCHTLLYPSA